MKKSSILLPLALLPALCAAEETPAQGELYAKLNVDGQYSDEGDGGFTEIRSNNSWIGVKGTLPVEEGITAVYRLEWKVDITAEDGDESLTERPQYVGIRTGYGEVTLGRNFTAVWMAQGKIDLYNHYEGDIKTIWKGENRLSDVATITTPSYRDARLIITYQAEKEADGDSAVSAGLFYGDQSLKKSRLFAAVAHDFDVEGFDVTRASVQFKLAGGKLGFMAQTQEPADGQGDSRSGSLVSYAYPIGKWELRGQLQTMEKDTTSNLGVDYHFGKRTKVFAWYANIDREDADQRSYFAVGFEHKLSKFF
ncbi:porin [Halioxenophilus sp. WMMB6]|uniref:porin n=1 Tax=Halioxenophilus sp. WMMB6 TaxID=3073815 RepID=UPI00295F4D70|nr:porin [Halioxenophilus sp. WMMB6]